MPFWHRLLIAAVVFAVVWGIARFVDWRLSKRKLPPEAVTRYRVFRRGIFAAIIVVGFFSALLVIPQVRAVAGGLLASSAVLALVIGIASQRTLGNFVAGLLIALSQPLRLGDRVVVDGEAGVVEDIGLTYTFIRAPDDTRIVVPNEKLASDTIRNATIHGASCFAQITVQLPLTADVGNAVTVLREVVADERESQVYVSSLEGNALIAVRVRAVNEDDAQRIEGELRLRAHGRLRGLGVYG